MRVRSFLWIAPFLGATFGYIICMYLLPSATHRMPSLVGLPITKALTIASGMNTNIRVRHTVVDPMVHQDTIIAQLPEAGATIKEQQSIFVTVACKKDAIPVPLMRGASVAECTKMLTALEVMYEIHPVPSDYPSGLCCAQHPEAHSIINPATTTVHLYTPSQQKTSVLWPDLRGYRLRDVIDFLHEYTMAINIHNVDDCTQESQAFVVAHKPCAGSIVTLNPEKTLSVELYVGRQQS